MSEEREGFETTDEAKAVLEATRKSLLDPGRDIAEEMIRATGKPTHAAAVRAEMDKRGLPVREVDGRWSGVLFKDPRFKPTGEFYQPVDGDYENTPGNTHIGTSKLRFWTLA